MTGEEGLSISAETVLAIIGVAIIVVTFGVILMRKIPKRIRSAHYVKKWREIQKMCANKEDWSHAIIHADMLLDEIMMKKKIVGKTMGERMVSVQKRFSAHEAVWDAHKLANNLRQNSELKVTKPKIKSTLVAYRQALRDLGAL